MNNKIYIFLKENILVLKNNFERCNYKCKCWNKRILLLLNVGKKIEYIIII